MSSLFNPAIVCGFECVIECQIYSINKWKNCISKKKGFECVIECEIKCKIAYKSKIGSECVIQC